MWVCLWLDYVKKQALYEVEMRQVSGSRHKDMQW